MESQVKVCIVDDSNFFLDGLIFYIESETDWEIVQVEKSGSELLDKGLIAIPDIILMDINMPQLNGIDTAILLFERYARYNIKVMAVTMYSDNYISETLIEAGFKGCLLKQNVYIHLKEAVKLILSGGVFYSCRSPS